MKNIEKLLTPYFCDRYHVNRSEQYELEYIPARNLLVRQRIDLMAKYIYVKSKVTGLSMDWAETLYVKHLEAFSGGTFCEPGKEEKNSAARYLAVFNDLIESIHKEGVDSCRSVIPVGADNAIMDGAHRVAVAAFFEMEVPCIRFSKLKADNGAVFFENAMLDRKYLDSMIMQYIRLKSDIHIGCLWPKALENGNIGQAEEMLTDKLSIVYKKKIHMNYNGLRNLMIQVYEGFEWLGGLEKHFRGATGKADACFAENETMYVYVLEGGTLEQIINTKEIIRNIYQTGKHSIHITDTHIEAVQIAGLLLNDNSANLLNCGRPDVDPVNWKYLLDMSEKGFAVTVNEKVMGPVSTSLALYGISQNGLSRACFIPQELSVKGIKERVEMVSTDHYLIAERYILSPEYYYEFLNVKLPSLSLILIMNKKGIIVLEKETIKRIYTILAGEKTLKNILADCIMSMQRHCRNIKIRVREYLRKNGKLSVPMKIYHILFGKK